MEISTNKFVYILLMTVLITTVLTSCAIFALQHSVSTHQTPSPKANVFMFVDKVDVQYWVGSGNVITNIGEEETRDRHSQNGTYVAINWISIGNVTAGVTKTQLDSQYDRKLGAITEWTNAGDYAFNVTYTWMFGETVRIDGAGGHWASSGDNNLYSCANFAGGAVTFNLNDNCTIVWVYTYDAN